MFHSAGVKVDRWTAEEVASWITGLDNTINSYHTNFVRHNITGKRLLMLDHNDLQRIGVYKLGHQEAILESLELLLSINNELHTCNLQSLALVVTCRISYLHRILEQQQSDTDHEYNRKLVDAVSFLIESLKRMMNWLKSRPFNNMDEFGRLNEHIERSTLSVLSVFSKSSRVQSITKNKSYVLDKLAEIESKCDDLVKNGSNPMILTPASLENVTVRKRADEPLGLHLHSTQQGVHTIKLIRDNTACDSISKLEPADEIVLVNQQLVVGWQLASVVRALKKNPKEVNLTVRKSPRHFNLQSFTQRRLKNQLALGDELKQSTFPKRASKHGSDEGSFDGKIKSCSIGDSPTAAVMVAESVATPNSATDEVFTLSPCSSDVSQLSGYTQEGWQSGSEASNSRKSSRPTILVNDVWDPQHSVGVDSPPPNPAVAASGKKEILSTFHVIKSTPELRTPDSEQLPYIPHS